MERRKKTKLTATQSLVLGVVVVIFIGAIILKLPISNNEGRSIKFLDSLFVSTSCVCVTGLTTVVPSEQFSKFGQIVLMCLIEIGGLGFMSFIALILMFMGRKINLSDRMLIKESLNQNNVGGLIKLIKKIFLYTITFQIVGMLLLSIRFIPKYGVGEGLFYSAFHSISAFCNAGIDIIGRNSFSDYQYDILINVTLMLLIIIGGLGFTVWDDIFNTVKERINKNSGIWRNLTIHTKIVLITTIILLISGTILTFTFEKNNVHIMKSDSVSQKILKSVFYSTTLRTAGITTTNPDKLTTATKFISVIYMFIGGSPASTTGGIKNVTFAIIILMVISFIKGNDSTIVFKREIPFKIIKRAIAVVTISICIVATAIILLTVTEQLYLEQNYNMISESIDFIGIIYEAFSAFGTVGISLGVTRKLSLFGKIIIMILMFIGRLGPITLSFALFSKYNKKRKSSIKYPQCDLLVG